MSVVSVIDILPALLHFPFVRIFLWEDNWTLKHLSIVKLRIHISLKSCTWQGCFVSFVSNTRSLVYRQQASQGKRGVLLLYKGCLLQHRKLLCEYPVACQSLLLCSSQTCEQKRFVPCSELLWLCLKPLHSCKDISYTEIHLVPWLYKGCMLHYCLVCRLKNLSGRDTPHWGVSHNCIS